MKKIFCVRSTLTVFVKIAWKPRRNLFVLKEHLQQHCKTMWNAGKTTQFHNLIKYVYKKLKKADNFIQRIDTSMKTEKYLEIFTLY